jgi:hypothetical protein
VKSRKKTNKGERRKMKIAKNKTKAIAIAMFLMLSIGASMMLVPTANAHTPAWEIPTFAFIMAVPNPIGVGQYTHIFMWIDKPFTSALLVNDYRFHNYQLTITKPDNTTETKTWDTTWDTTSSQGYNYAPDQAGTYTLKFEFPGQAVNTYSHADTAYVNDTYKASSATTTLTVQEEPISDFPTSYPLPTEYWTRPIYGENPYWWSISSDWLGTGSPQLTGYSRYVHDAVGPQTSHIMWTKPLQAGGVVGGDNFAVQGDTYFEGSAYISRYRNPIILNGKLYYKGPVGFASASGGPTQCVDLRTGEVIWSRDDVPSLSFGYIYDTQQPNQHGVMQAVLCTSNFARCFDADTGNPLFNFTSVPSGTTAMGPQGEILRYVIANAGNSTNPNYYLAQWNSSKPFFGTGLTPSQSGNIPANAPITPAPSGTNTYWNGSMWVSNSVRTAQGYAAVQWPAYDWNISIPWRNTMPSTPSVINAWYNDVMICRNGSLPGFGLMGGDTYIGTPYTYFAVQLNASKGAIGSALWWNTVNAAAGNITVGQGVADPTVGVFTECYKETSQWVGYSMTTGQKLWGPTPSQAALDYYGYFYPGLTEGMRMAPGKLYSAGMAGIIYCYDMATGNLLWTYGNGGEGNSTNSGFQVPGPYPTFIYAIGNGIIYTMDTEHTVETPIYKGALTRAINATDGTEIWTLSNYNGAGVSAAAIADGFATFMNGYDNQIYVVGRGPSATTVQAPMTAITAGNSVVIQGTVTDISAGTKQNQQAADFPNGVPAVSDASMEDWMGYVYQQKPFPTNAAGVEVTLDAVDPNGNFVHLGTATSDASGTFGYAWTTPDVPGKYTVIAAFAGSESYWPSYAETHMVISEAPPATPTPTPAAPLPPFDLYILIATVVIVIAIAIVGLMILRKRP